MTADLPRLQREAEDAREQLTAWAHANIDIAARRGLSWCPGHAESLQTLLDAFAVAWEALGRAKQREQDAKLCAERERQRLEIFEVMAAAIREAADE